MALEKVFLGNTQAEFVDKINKAIEQANTNSDDIFDLSEAVQGAGKVDNVTVNGQSVLGDDKVAKIAISGSNGAEVAFKSGGTEIEISVPELAGKATAITLSMDTSTYTLTAKLKDKNGNDLSTSTIDFPLETMVVNASYNNTTKEITLTLQNGNTTSFSVADLVSGLATSNDIKNQVTTTDTLATNEIIVGNGGKAVKGSGITIQDNMTTGDSTKVPTSHAVVTYVTQNAARLVKASFTAILISGKYWSRFPFDSSTSTFVPIKAFNSSGAEVLVSWTRDDTADDAGWRLGSDIPLTGYAYFAVYPQTL